MKLNTSRLILSSVVLTTLILGGCARDISSATYAESTVGEASQTYRGTVVGVRKVTVAPETLQENIIGGATGAVIGGLAASH